MRLREGLKDSPIVSKLSFKQLADLLKRISESGKVYESEYAAALLSKFKEHKELAEGTVDLEIIERERDFVDEVMSLIFPSALTLNEIKGATPPFNFEFIYTSQRLKNILNNAGEDFDFELKSIDQHAMYVMACVTILQAFYKKNIPLSNPIVFEIPNKVSGQSHYYRSAFNADLMDIKPNEKAIEITEEIYHELLDNYDDLEIWKKYFPVGSWEISGIGIINLQDVSLDEILGQMTTNLLEADRDSIEKVGQNIKELLQIPNLKLSFIRLDGNHLKSGMKGKDETVLMANENMLKLDVLCSHSRHLLMDLKEPFILSDVEDYYERNNVLCKKLQESSVQSYILCPVIYNDNLLGFIELASAKKRELNSIIFQKFKLALPILSMAVNRLSEEYKIKIEAIIQEQCTSIHPSVKWKFEEIAHEILSAREEDKEIHFKDISFPDVYPLYGQLDIKSSSVIRNQAVLSDILDQLVEVSSILKETLSFEALPAYEEMLFRIEKFIKEFEIGLFEGSEQRVLTFLKDEIYPAFEYIKEIDASLEQRINEYNKHLNQNTGTIYEKRKNFDDSVAIINSHLSNYIDKKQVNAQKMFPHYFERFKTDGLEFNLYIGQSMSEHKKFNPIYLDNLHLWQLQTMVEMEREIHYLNQDLPTPLEVASLILLFSNPLSIKFSIDDKHFDVDGAYNARYEIIKKRIDKAHIKNSNERITQPGKIAIIYTNKDEANNYRKHIDYLESKGLLVKHKTEDYELEELQGVAGLKALRVSINYENENAKELENTKANRNIE